MSHYICEVISTPNTLQNKYVAQFFVEIQTNNIANFPFLGSVLCTTAKNLTKMLKNNLSFFLNFNAVMCTGAKKQKKCFQQNGVKSSAKVSSDLEIYRIPSLQEASNIANKLRILHFCFWKLIPFDKIFTEILAGWLLRGPQTSLGD